MMGVAPIDEADALNTPRSWINQNAHVSIIACRPQLLGSKPVAFSDQAIHTDALPTGRTVALRRNRPIRRSVIRPGRLPNDMRNPELT